MMDDSKMKSSVHAFYKFVRLPDYRDLKDPLQHCCEDAGVTGTILLAEEGINGTVAGTDEGLAKMWAFIMSDPRLADIQYKASDSETESFYRMKGRLKKEIVTLGIPGIDPTREVGTYVEPDEWNELIRDPDVVVMTGGWVSLPVMLSGVGGRPTVLIETNAVPGKVGRLLAGRVDLACLADDGVPLTRRGRSAVTGVRWKMTRRSASFAASWMTCTPLAPVPMMPTWRPAKSTPSSGQSAVWWQIPA